ncbi:hypothetical protein BD410DRAFT_765514 [Rickenella mellea]|uniref:MI domain-containing protein n=1 Tax=Rickenella mellea TaxID=50990 RepID=A0A4Y7QEM3_9AGAM|nr:hypothetical protein BD410DRAFT_765514 [Rickenella mellea]
MSFRNSTTKLPLALRERIAENADTHVAGGLPRRRKASRKEIRQANRQALKKRKAQSFLSTRKRGVPLPYEESSTQSKKPRLHESNVNIASSSSQPTTNGKGSTLEAKAAAKPLRLPSSPPRTETVSADYFTRRRSKEAGNEDAYIAMLEAKLGVKKDSRGKVRYSAAFDDDGLLDLLVDLDAGQSPSANGVDEVEGSSDLDSDATNLSDESVDAEDSEDSEEWQGFGSMSPPTDGTNIIASFQDSAETDKMSTGTRYIPPQRRQLQSDESESVRKLSRQLKGLLNRLSEQNIATILKELESLYQTHRRHDMTATVTSLVIEGTCSHSTLLDSYVTLHAGLVACLHKIVGVDFGAYFVQHVVLTYERHYSTIKSASDDPLEITEVGKECTNLVVLLTELYNLQVISCVLIYDIIRDLLDGELKEMDVELLLKLTRNAGPQLHQDDPSALKDIIQMVHSKVSGQNGTLSSRTRFMIETLTNLKNNKIKRQTAHSSGGEAHERLRKFVAGIGKHHHVVAHEPLRFSLQDLRNADSKGKWWLVGAAWGGDPLVERQDMLQATTQKEAGGTAQESLMKLARKQGMNTDVRRSIFVVLMSSEDYVDACDRLSQINLSEIQQREIIRVVLRCCGNEKVYNPYYTLIGQQLCRSSHSHRITLQFCLWDFLRSFGETLLGGSETMQQSYDTGGAEHSQMTPSRIQNIAKAYAWWIAKGYVTLAMLKPVDFISLKPSTRAFLHELFKHVFLYTQDTSPVPTANFKNAVLNRKRDALEEVMLKLVRLPTLAKGIDYFLSTAFGDVENADDDIGRFVKWACGVAKDALRVR